MHMCMSIYMYVCRYRGTGSVVPSCDIDACQHAHWRVSRPLSTHHLLGVIATANTLMSMTHSSFAPQKVRARSPLARYQPNSVFVDNQH